MAPIHIFVSRDEKVIKFCSEIKNRSEEAQSIFKEIWNQNLYGPLLGGRYKVKIRTPVFSFRKHKFFNLLRYNMLTLPHSSKSKHLIGTLTNTNDKLD